MLIVFPCISARCVRVRAVLKAAAARSLQNRLLFNSLKAPLSDVFLEEPSSFRLARNFLTSLSMRFMSSTVNGLSECFVVCSIIILHGLNHFFNECDFFFREAVLRVEVGICPRTAEVLERNKAEVSA